MIKRSVTLAILALATILLLSACSGASTLTTTTSAPGAPATTAITNTPATTGTTPASPTQTAESTTSASPAGPTSPTPTNDSITASAGAANGLKLSLTVNSATFNPGEEVLISLAEENTLSTSNKVSTAKQWAMQGLTLGPCGTINYPFGIALFQGDFTSENLPSSKPLYLYDPGAVYQCPMILADITGYDFQPSSDIADIFAGSDQNPAISNMKMNTTVSAGGYWPDVTTSTIAPQLTVTPSTPFSKGIYTVFGGDEWGTLVILHFTVQ